MAVGGGAAILSHREAYTLCLSLVLCLELFEKFVVGGWGVVETYFSVQRKPRPS